MLITVTVYDENDITGTIQKKKHFQFQILLQMILMI